MTKSAGKRTAFIWIAFCASLIPLNHKIVDALWGILDEEGFFEDVSMAVTKHHGMILFGIIRWNVHGLASAVVFLLKDVK